MSWPGAFLRQGLASMQVLFVHGMGRSPLSGWPMLCRLKANGIAVVTFGYAVTFEDFASIRARLALTVTGVE